MPQIVYFWWAVALALMAAEALLPGAFLLWFGFAAAAMGAIVWLLPSMPPIAQALVFALLSIVSVWIYRRWFRKLEPVSDQPLLNRRVEQMIGRTYVLTESITNGYGKIRVNDALWTVQGPELPEGVRVVVTGAAGMNLVVRVAE